jgi:hypothetical protein
MPSTLAHKARTLLVKANLLHRIAGNEPWPAFLLALAVGVGLAVWSSVIGVGFFWVKIKIFHTGGVEDRQLNLGFLDQVNYGVWYVFPVFCPFLFMFISWAYKSTGILTVRTSRFIMPFDKFKGSWHVAAVGLVILLTFVGKNVYVELEDYKSLGLGWVQGGVLQEYRTEIAASGPIDLTAKGKKFDQFLITTKKEFIARDNIQRVILEDVDPGLNIKSYWGMVAFIVAAKIWVGLWEALVVYTAVLTFLWGTYALAHIKAEDVVSQDRKRYELAWFYRPALYLILVGVWVHLFCIFRFCGNAIKGSYGKWDQYWSMLTLSPAVIVIVLGCFILSKIHMFPNLEGQTYLSKGIGIVLGVWTATFIYISYLLLGYIDPQSQEVLVMCFRPFAEILGKIFSR